MDQKKRYNNGNQKIFWTEWLWKYNMSKFVGCK